MTLSFVVLDRFLQMLWIIRGFSAKTYTFIIKTVVIDKFYLFHFIFAQCDFRWI